MLNIVSKSCEEWGKPSTSKSSGKSPATAASPAGPSLANTVAASRYCRPSERTSTRRRTNLGLIGMVLSLRIRSPHSRISLHWKSLLECWRCWVLARFYTGRHTNILYTNVYKLGRFIETISRSERCKFFWCNLLILRNNIIIFHLCIFITINLLLLKK